MRIVLAFCGLLTLAAAEPKNTAPHPKSETDQKMAAALEAVAHALEHQREPSQADKPCKRGEDQRSSDLCAQWFAADAADSAARASWWLGGFGLVIGGLTLAAAVAAAKYAKDAAVQTREANAIMRLAEDAHLALDVGDGKHGEHDGLHFLTFDLTITNVGRSPLRIHDIETDEERTSIEATIAAGERQRFEGAIFHPLNGPPPCVVCSSGDPVPPLNIRVDQTTPLRGRFSERFTFHLQDHGNDKWSAYFAGEERHQQTQQDHCEHV
jgi:hypothetical protein